MFYKHNLFVSSLFQGRRCFKKVTVAGTVTLHHRYIYRGYLQIACVDLTRSGHPALWFVLWDPSQETATRPRDGDAPARDSEGRNVVHLRLRHHEKRLRGFRARRLHPHELQLRAVRRGLRFRRRHATLPMVIGTLRLGNRIGLLQLPPLLPRLGTLA